MPSTADITIVVSLSYPQVPGWHFSSAQAERLRGLVPRSQVIVCRDEQDFTAALPGADVAVVWRFRQEWFALAPRLRVLATPAAGRDYSPLQPPAGVHLMYGRFHGEIMAETAVAMVLAMTRGVLPAAAMQQSHLWPRAQLAQVMHPLRGSHVVILGFGSIGTWIARLLKPFGVRITGIRRSCQQKPDFLDEGDRVLGLDSLDAALPSAQHLIMVLPGGAGTDSLMDRRRLGLLPRGATVCNLGRGNSLDEAALVVCLKRGRLGGACLDVFRCEPLPLTSPLRHCPNLWLMPHASALSPTYLNLFVDEFGPRLHSLMAGRSGLGTSSSGTTSSSF